MTIQDEFNKRRREMLTSQAALFSRECGISAAELVRITKGTESPLRRMLHASVEAGDLFVVGGTKSHRYFATKAAASRFIAPPLARPRAKRTSMSFKLQTVSTEGVKVTICPSGIDMRYRVVGSVVGGFATMGIGRYFDEVNHA